MRPLRISASITVRDSESVSKYLNEISKIPMVTAEEEVNLAILVRQGNHEARQRLINANLRFVVSVAKQFQHQGVSLSDLINEGNIGLVRAAEKFDPSRGFKFISFAIWHIRQTILYAISEYSYVIQIPVNKQRKKRQIEKMQHSMEQQLDRIPSEEELAEAMNMKSAELRQYLAINGCALSLDAPLHGEEQTSLIDMVRNENSEAADVNITYNESLRDDLGRSLDTLDERQRDMICLYFGIGREQPISIEDIAFKYSLTGERVRQIRDKAIKKLKTNANREILRYYLQRA